MARSAEAAVDVRSRLEPAEVAEVARLVWAATDADNVRPLSEHVTLHLRHGGDAPGRNLLLRLDDGQLAGYAHLDVTDPLEGASAELVVDPAMRGRGLGRRLVRALAEQARESTAGERPLRLWAHGGHDAAGRLAAAMGFERVRELWQMRRSLFSALAEPVLPDGVALRTFVPGQDEEAWLALNARAFADHPEQGGWSLDDLRGRMAEPWFDPAGFFLAVADGKLVGFHWTKVHGGGSGEHVHPDGSTHGHDPIGEVYVVGVSPDAQGTGLGKALTLVGLRHLRALGLPDAMLYVESDNAAAIALYTGLGFQHYDTDVMYRLSTDRSA